MSDWVVDGDLNPTLASLASMKCTIRCPDFPMTASVVGRRKLVPILPPLLPPLASGQAGGFLRVGFPLPAGLGANLTGYFGSTEEFSDQGNFHSHSVLLASSWDSTVGSTPPAVPILRPLGADAPLHCVWAWNCGGEPTSAGPVWAQVPANAARVTGVLDARCLASTACELHAQWAIPTAREPNVRGADSWCTGAATMRLWYYSSLLRTMRV